MQCLLAASDYQMVSGWQEVIPYFCIASHFSRYICTSFSCPFLLEENCICTFLGRIGCIPVNEYKSNYSVLRLALTCSTWGLLCTVFAAIALTENTSILRITNFSRGKLTSKSGLLEPVEIYIGLRGLVYDNPNTVGELYIAFDQFCGLKDLGLDAYMDPEDCAKCDDMTIYFYLCLLISLIAFIPSIATDLLRLYPLYDVNCQRVFGALHTLVSIGGSVMLWWLYWEECLPSFYDGEVNFSRTGDRVEPGDDTAAILVNFEWKIGYALMILWAGAGLKVINFICSCCVSTPSITRNRQEQEDYEAMEYPIKRSWDE
jgi:hypothetical protein